MVKKVKKTNMPTKKMPSKAVAKTKTPEKTVKPVVAEKKSAPAKVSKPVVPAPVAMAEHKVTGKNRFDKKDLLQFKHELIAMRDRIINQSGAMKTAALQRTDEVNVEEDGTDAFMRLQTLEQVGNQQSVISNINESLHAIDDGTYGVCDMCGELIGKQRLLVLPFAKNCIKCQSDMERFNRGGRR